MITIEELKELSNDKLLEEVVEEAEKYIDKQIRFCILSKGKISAYVGTRKYSMGSNVNTDLKKIISKLGDNIHLQKEFNRRIIKKYSDEGYKIEIKCVDIGYNEYNNQFVINWGHLLKKED